MEKQFVNQKQNNRPSVSKRITGISTVLLSMIKMGKTLENETKILYNNRKELWLSGNLVNHLIFIQLLLHYLYLTNNNFINNF